MGIAGAYEGDRWNPGDISWLVPDCCSCPRFNRISTRRIHMVGANKPIGEERAGKPTMR
jgi:hypothetical protein